MRCLLILSLLLSFKVLASSGVKGKVLYKAGCGDKVMVWLSLDKSHLKQQLLLMHTEVPQKGSYQFFLKPGDYQVRATDPEGCEFLKRIRVKDTIQVVDIQMEKK